MFDELWEISKSITSHALYTESVWPNVTLPHFDMIIHGENTRYGRHSNNVEFVGFAPFIVPSTKEGWEAYSVQNQQWLQHDIEYRIINSISHPSLPTKLHR